MRPSACGPRAVDGPARRVRPCNSSVITDGLLGVQASLSRCFLRITLHAGPTIRFNGWIAWFDSPEISRSAGPAPEVSRHGGEVAAAASERTRAAGPACAGPAAGVRLRPASPRTRVDVKDEHQAALVVLREVAVRHPAARVRDVEEDVDGLVRAHEHSIPPDEVRLGHAVAREGSGSAPRRANSNAPAISASAAIVSPMAKTTAHHARIEGPPKVHSARNREWALIRFRGQLKSGSTSACALRTPRPDDRVRCRLSGARERAAACGLLLRHTMKAATTCPAAYFGCPSSPLRRPLHEHLSSPRWPRPSVAPPTGPSPSGRVAPAALPSGDREST
jgi:hypothetical protein